MHGDRVVVRIERIKEGGRAEGRIIRILERANEWIVGRYERDDSSRGESRAHGMGYVAPFDRRVLMDILIPPGQEGGASPGCSATSTRPASTLRSSSGSTGFPTRIRPRRLRKRHAWARPCPSATSA